MLNLIPVVFRPDFRVLPLRGPGQKLLPSTAQLEDAAKAKRDDPLHSANTNALTAKVSKRPRAIVDENHSSSIVKRPKTDVNDRTTGKWWGATSMPPGWRCKQCTTRQPSMETIKCVSCMAPPSVSTITPLFQGNQTTGTSTLSSASGGATSNFGAGAITGTGFVFGSTMLQAAPNNAHLTVSKRRKVRAKRPHKRPTTTGPPRRNPPRASRK